MTKTKRIVAVLVAAFVLLASLMFIVACGGNPEGTYKLDNISMEIGGQTLTYNKDNIDELAELPGFGEMAAVTFTSMFEMELTLNDDGTMTASINGEEAESEGTSNWKLEDGKIIFTDENGEALEEMPAAEFKDNSIIMSQEQSGIVITMTYKKI